MRHLIYIILSTTITLIAISTACKPNGQQHQGSKTGDARYTLEAAMSIYDNAPEKALAILDSAIVMGNVDPIDADIMRAHIFASSCENRNLDSAQRLCEQLMELEQVKKDKNELFNVLEQLVDISWKRQDDEQLLFWARQFAELCHERGDTVEALRAKAEIGLALYRLGNRDEGNHFVCIWCQKEI